MHRRREARRFPALVICAFALAPSCTKPSKDAPREAIATVDGEVITADQLRLAAGQIATAEGAKGALDELVRLQVLANEARRRGLHEEPAFVRLVNQQLASRLLREIAEGEAAAKVDEASVAAYYAEHVTEFQTPERRRFAQLVVADSKMVDVVTKELGRQHSVQNVIDDQKWRRAVEKHSVDLATKNRAGDVGYISASDPRVAPAVRKAVFEGGAPGQVVGPVEGPTGPVFVRLTAVETATERDLKTVAPLIRARLQAEARNRARAGWEAQLRDAATVEIDEARLKAFVEGKQAVAERAAP